MKSNSINELKMEIIKEMENIEFAMGQGASVVLSVHEALHSTDEGKDYALALHLASSLLSEQRDKLYKLIDVVLKVGGGNDEK